MLYRQAVDPDATKPEEVDVIAVVEGFVTDVRCGICGRVRTWWPEHTSGMREMDNSL